MPNREKMKLHGDREIKVVFMEIKERKTNPRERVKHEIETISEAITLRSHLPLGIHSCSASKVNGTAQR
jgi:hypothetical protein